MNVLYLLVPLALLLAGSGVAAFVWSVRDGQYDDVETPAMRILMEDDVPGPTSKDDPDTDATPPSRL
ncbi:MAG: cbb3-type cytochrome oxidase assembly protein CcoS [Longimonas sp.]|uniref:cbb3-type cytochrome oxidase assembly protein CcoS n=1 Tax=Longimonas sp. TaxID=2039626 RepID=UPI00397475FC